MAHFSPTGDEVAVRLDDVDLGPPDVRNHAAENPSTPSDVDENSWLVWDLDVAQAAPATHRIEVVLVQRDRRIRPPLEVANVEMWTRCNCARSLVGRDAHHHESGQLPPDGHHLAKAAARPQRHAPPVRAGRLAPQGRRPLSAWGP